MVSIGLFSLINAFTHRGKHKMYFSFRPEGKNLQRSSRSKREKEIIIVIFVLLLLLLIASSLEDLRFYLLFLSKTALREKRRRSESNQFSTHLNPNFRLESLRSMTDENQLKKSLEQHSNKSISGSLNLPINLLFFATLAEPVDEDVSRRF